MNFFLPGERAVENIEENKERTAVKIIIRFLFLFFLFHTEIKEREEIRVFVSLTGRGGWGCTQRIIDYQILLWPTFNLILKKICLRKSFFSRCSYIMTMTKFDEFEFEIWCFFHRTYTTVSNYKDFLSCYHWVKYFLQLFVMHCIEFIDIRKEIIFEIYHLFYFLKRQQN